MTIKEVNNEYHKGQKCLYGSNFCQEGFCSGCQIYLGVLSQAVKKSLEVEETRERELVLAR